jgi:hemerythrin
MTIQWTNTLPSGIADLDAQHEEMFRRAGRLLDAMSGRDASGDFAARLEDLQSFAVEHFRREETWMRETSFPGFIRHKAEHDRFVEDLHALAREHAARGNRAFGAMRASQWLAQWMKDHVSGTDAELGRFLARRTA